jgi:hypothetical protein
MRFDLSDEEWAAIERDFLYLGRRCTVAGFAGAMWP